MLINRREVYIGRVFRVEVDTIELPTGRTVEMEIVRHPRSVVLLAMPAPDSIVLVRQYRHALDRWIWELPAGSVDPGEHPDAAAARECEEEIGLVPGRLERLRGYYPTPGFCDEEMIYYRCLDLRPPAPGSAAARDEDEALEPRTFTLGEARALVHEGEIVDMKTALGLALL